MKKFLALPIAIASTFALALPVFAAGTIINTCDNTGQFGALCNLSFNGGLIGRLITFAFVIAIILALAWLIYGGIRWILSQGDKGKVDSARQHIIAALIGLIIVFLSYFLLNIVLTFFGVGGINGLRIPTLTTAGVPCGSATVCDPNSTNNICLPNSSGTPLCCPAGTTSSNMGSAGCSTPVLPTPTPTP